MTSPFKQLVLVINGRPRAGKDTALAYMETQFQILGWRTQCCSSIDPVRNVLTTLGIDTSAKTPRDRDLLAEVGRSLETHSGYRTDACMSEIGTFFQPGAMKQNRVFFLQMREPDLIAVMHQKCTARDYSFGTILVTGVRGLKIDSNAADAGTDDMRYDYAIPNNGDFGDLAKDCTDYVQRFYGENS